MAELVMYQQWKCCVCSTYLDWLILECHKCKNLRDKCKIHSKQKISKSNKKD